ncbi:hypothetical protein IG631_23941 [Alternaria alternata]|nr:hypothetical protein IG631_23941 [Alternaria alternata]
MPCSDCTSARRCRMIWTLFWSSHSSSASTTSTYFDWPPLFSRRDKGPSTSSRHCSSRDWLAISLCFCMASQILRFEPGMLLASWTAMLVMNLPAWLTSPPAREKKKLAASRLFAW